MSDILAMDFFHYKRAENLRQHAVTHKEKQFKCTQCDKAYKIPVDLKKHVILHTGDWPYKCIECNKVFTQLGYIQKHMIAHTREKQFKCTKA